MHKQYFSGKVAGRYVVLVAALAFSMLALSAFGLLGCSQNNSQANTPRTQPYTALDAYPLADMSGYACAENYMQDYVFRDISVAEVASEMDAGTSFVLYCGFNTCPWCNSILNYLNDVALDRNISVAYIDTRKDPAWQNNLDLLDYDLFAEKFASELSEDENGIPHLYVPHIFFVRNGQLVSSHSGTVPTHEIASDPLTEEEVAQFKQTLTESLESIGL